jgi:putative effector of murein hydrolase
MDQIGSLLERPKAYCNIDGVGELSIGFMCLGFGLLGWLQLHAPLYSAWHSMWALFIYVGVMLLIVNYGSKAIKNRITYPRTGFVEYRKRDAVWLPAIIGAAVAAPISVGVAFALRGHWNMTAPALLFGLFLAAIYAYRYARTVRWKWAVACAMVCGSLTIAILPADLIGARDDLSWTGAWALSMMLYGILTLVSGGISFWLYLRHTQAPAQDAQ